MKKILGLDLGTNSIGWALIENDFEEKEGKILANGSRIIPMTQDVLDKFGSGQSHSQTAERTGYRGVRRLNQRHLLRRERLHRVLNILGFLPEHYANAIDFEKNFGQFKKGEEVKLNYNKVLGEGKEKPEYHFLFKDSFLEMVEEFKAVHPELFYKKTNGEEIKIPYDWTIYYLRKKALEEKVSKEELAWLLINFNQKRGYYQLRGEEEEDQSKSFEVLKVKEVIDSGEQVKGNILYDIVFENGWFYDKQITKPEEWIGKEKEFIVTSKLNKDGSIKRTYKKVDSEKDWIAIKKKTEQDINQSNKTIGCFIYDSLLNNPTQKLNGKLVKTIERKFYKEELKAIINKQIDLYTELKDRDLYQACINELYPKNEAHRNNIAEKNFEYLFVEDILFYQRPLKSKKSTISTCLYEYRTYKKKDEETKDEKWVKEPLKCISKSNPIFIEFRLWQFLRNLKIYEQVGKKDVDLTPHCLPDENAWCDLFDFLNDKKEVDQKSVIDYFIKNKRLEKIKKDVYCWNYVSDKKYPMNELRAQIISRLKKINIDSNFLNKEREIHLWHIIYSVKDKGEFEQALRKYAIRYEIDADGFVDNFKKFPPFASDYGSYSEKAIKKLLPLMRVGKYWDESEIEEKVKQRISDIMARIETIKPDTLPEKENKRRIELDLRIENSADDDIPARLIKSFLPFYKQNPLSGLNTYQACYSVYGRHSETGDLQKWNTPGDIDSYLDAFKQHSLRNPIVEQVVTETLRTVRDIWQYHGQSEEKFFDEIHVELGREMKNSADKRKKISEKNTENENTNERIKLLLQELKDEYQAVDIRPYSPSHQEILKIYEEGVFLNPEVKYKDIKEDEVLKIRKNSSPTKSEIIRYKLWLEQKYISPYTGQPIPLSGLFSSDYQIEHIIPQSRYFDDSLSNKVICESAVNAEKSNKTAYEFMKNPGKSIIDLGNGNSVRLLSFDAFEDHCSLYFKKNRTKLKNLLSEDIPDGFINRQMNDSRYISKFIKGLLSNIVREEGEQEATSKNLLPISGAVTSKLKQDWGLNEKWNEIIAPRFQRLNELTNSNDFGYWDYQKDENGKPVGKQFFRLQVPKEAGKLNKKRIDHRHHSLDAIVIASCTREHQNYLNSLNSERENHGLKERLLIKNKQGDFTKHFQLPWKTYHVEVKNCLETTVVSFKQNLRVINKTNNKTWQWCEEDGKLKKKLVKQEKGDNWAIRKALHKETVSGSVEIKREKKGLSNLTSYLQTPELIVDTKIRKKVKSLRSLFDNDIKQIRKYLKDNPITIEGKEVGKIKVYEWTKNATATRTSLTEKFTRKQLDAVTDSGIRTILDNHVKNYFENGKERFDLAFNSDGIEELNKNIKLLNNGKDHQPIYKVRLYEEGSKFEISDDKTSQKNKKYVEAAKGTNLFFAIYWNEEKQKRVYETVPLHEVIAHQKQTASLPKEEKTPIAVKPELGEFLFVLSPNDLVYVPTDEEMENPNMVNFDKLSIEEVSNIYLFIDGSGTTANFIPVYSASTIFNLNSTEQKKRGVNFIIQNEYGVGSPQSKNQKSINGLMIKERCWKLKVDRLGNITKVIKPIGQELHQIN